MGRSTADRPTRYGLSYRDVEERLAERGVEVDHVTICRWVQTFTPEFIDAARPSRHAVGGRWFFDETYVKVARRWTYLYRAVDQHGQVIDVLVLDELEPLLHVFGQYATSSKRIMVASKPGSVPTPRAVRNRNLASVSIDNATSPSGGVSNSPG